MIKRVTKEDVIKRLFDDPEWPRIERHIKTLNHLIDDEPERARRILDRLKLPKNYSVSQKHELV